MSYRDSILRSRASPLFKCLWTILYGSMYPLDVSAAKAKQIPKLANDVNQGGSEDRLARPCIKTLLADWMYNTSCQSGQYGETPGSWPAPPTLTTVRTELLTLP